MMNRKRHTRCFSITRSAGFTLLELMISISIFAALSILSYAGLHEIQKAQIAIESSMQSLGNIQKALRRFELDMSHQVNRHIYSASKATVLSFTASDNPLLSIELTRAGIDPQVNRVPNELMRVGYQYENGTLFRLYWPVLDRSDVSTATRYAILKNITQLQFIYYDDKKVKHSQWPPTNTSNARLSPSGVPIIEPPVAVEIVFESKDLGTFRKLVPLNNYQHNNLSFTKAPVASGTKK
ncbi:hypothetical protein MNBD_GAMMA12-3364 [hydrothermal vent metagenome]|uniref:Type II secretion system protein J n=1 Tax=hydrothermal vent metagenome TaxID=652676 RepID=A0A3B0XYG7_9ZZZZ